MSATVIDYDPRMGRWEPNARGRLEQAALELYAERGFEQTTVADIADAGGAHERTFFRHFADKREVLFAGGEEFQALFVNGLAAAPASATPIDAIAVTLEAVSGFFHDRHDAPGSASGSSSPTRSCRSASSSSSRRSPPSSPARCASAASRSLPRA